MLHFAQKIYFYYCIFSDFLKLMLTLWKFNVNIKSSIVFMYPDFFQSTDRTFIFIVKE